jgi:cellulose synthase/poly-beta-1,6-N-acetylglucosamine synthase-like glycosyltransferase
MAIQRHGQGLRGRSRQPNPFSIVARTPGGAQPLRARPSLPVEHEYGFLVDVLVDRASLLEAEIAALDCGVPAHEVLLASGRISQSQYARLLAHRLGVRVVLDPAGLALGNAGDRRAGEAELPGVPARIAGRPCRLLSAQAAAPDILRRHVAALTARGIDVVLAPQACVDAALEAHLWPRRIDEAVHGLLRAQPLASAGVRHETWQGITGAVLAGLLIGGFAVLPDATIAALTALVALPFLCVTALRLLALRQALASRIRKALPERVPDRLLPVYSVLVPLYREANVLPGLCRALAALDYPAAKLEILLILEADDAATRTAALGLGLPHNFRILIAPDMGPRTKPKALNYALQFARGDLVVVYDAEDRPQPSQLRRAWDVFRSSGPDLACVQAQLNIDNAGASWLARQFTIEYSALFDAVLPALESLRLPVPLGGTSNHFPRRLLVELGAWDPFNVTEDADLGIRIARAGYRTAVLASTTWEEAPSVLGAWLRQRTRWLKGWMQTYLVHTRRLRQLHRELGPGSAIGFHALMGGLIASALMHPLFYALIAYHWLSGSLLAPAETTAGAVLWAIAAVNLGVGYLVSILVGVVSVLRRRRPGLALHALLMPLYWLLISAAAYRAAWQLVRDPYLWEKTEHGARRRRMA